MININVKQIIKECKRELIDIRNILSPTSVLFSRLTKYLTNYSIIKTCGTIEFSYKCIIADYFEEEQSNYIKNYLTNKIRESSMNPEMRRIHTLLNEFDEDVNDFFKSNLNQHSNKNELISSLHSLKEARNDLAHGGNPTLSFSNVVKYFNDSCKIIETLDDCLCKYKVYLNFSNFLSRFSI